MKKNCKNATCIQINPQYLESFTKNTRRKDGYEALCKTCYHAKRNAAYRKEHLKYRATAKKYETKFKEKIKLARKVYLLANLEKTKIYNANHKTKPNIKLKTCKREAARRGYSVEISLEQYILLIKEGLCHYCKASLPVAGHGLDRKDNTLGYTLKNVVPCCAKCNVTKGKYLTYEEMLMLMQFRKRANDEKS